MDVQRKVRPPAHCLDHHRADGQVRNEVAVHDIHVQEVRSRLDLGDLLAQRGEVRRQDRRRDLDHGLLLVLAGC
jgi:hypothetical protein